MEPGFLLRVSVENFACISTTARLLSRKSIKRGSTPPSRILSWLLSGKRKYILWGELALTFQAEKKTECEYAHHDTCLPYALLRLVLIKDMCHPLRGPWSSSVLPSKKKNRGTHCGASTNHFVHSDTWRVWFLHIWRIWKRKWIMAFNSGIQENRNSDVQSECSRFDFGFIRSRLIFQMPYDFSHVFSRCFV